MQAILFVSTEKPEFYPKINDHYTWVPVHGPMDFERLSELWHEHSPLAVYSYGSSDAWPALHHVYEVRKRWVHLQTLEPTLDVIPNVFTSMLNHEFDKQNPLMSIITTTFNSKHKIMRPFRSLRNQTYTNWEWVIWDDSESNETYEQLLKLQKRDLRIQVYKAPRHSGVIGEMKRRSAGLARGSYLVEIDHDDDFHPELLQWIRDAGEKYPDATFFYTDCNELTEDTFESVSYGEFFGLGYCVHYNTWSDLHQRYVIADTTPPPNALTLSHIVGVPNHVRAWRRDFYDKIGKHNGLLSVADDYELILRSYLEGKWCHIRECGYWQYRNADGNFTFIRNSLIQHNVAFIYQKYKHLLPPILPGSGSQQAWKFDHEEYPVTHYSYDPHPRKRTVYFNSPTVEEIAPHISPENRIVVIGVLPKIPREWASDIYWWNLTSEDPQDRVRYARKFLHRCEEFVVAKP